MIVVGSAADLDAHVGQHLGHSRFVEVTQQRIGRFVAATGDHGETPVLGYLTLALGPALLHDLLEWRNTRMGVNYGLGGVQFGTEPEDGSRVRLSATLLGADDLGHGGVQVTLETTFEIEGTLDRACVAELILRYYFNPT